MINLNDIPVIDWDDFEKASEITKQVVKELAADKATLRRLVYSIEDDPNLLKQCERHQLLDRLVIYDASEKNFKIRLNFTTQDHFDRPHDHRFSFTSLILRGSYRHIWYKYDREIYDPALDEIAKQWVDRYNPDDTSSIDIPSMEPLFITDERKNSCYTMHHSVIHATITTPDSLSLFLKGPGEKSRSIIADRQTNKLWWRYGETDETEERRRQKIMPVEIYRQLRAKLEAWEII